MLLLQTGQTVSELPIYNISVTTVILLLSILMGAVAAGAEVAFFALTSKDVNYLKTRTDNTSMQIVHLIERPRLLLSTLKSAKRVSIMICVGCSLYLLNMLIPNDISDWARILALIALNIVLVVLIIEVLPKVYARQNGVRMTMFSAPLIGIIFSFFKNFVGGLNSSHSLEERDYEHSNTLSQEELHEAVALRLGHEPSKEEVDIFKGIMKFGQITVKQVMQPRMNISGIRSAWDLNKVRQKIISSRFSRMPVYDGTIDNIIGMLYTKDLVPFIDKESMDWHSLLRDVFYIHENKLIEDLFQEFQTRRVHAAIVVDEFGGTSGMVTLEDIMEEVVGEIRDEFDEDVLNFKKIDDETYIFEGKTLINEMCRIIGIPYDTFDLHKGESSSLGGLILEVAKRFPAVDDKVTIESFEFTVLAIEKLHIERVKVKKL